jgi:hypothetical protein
MDEEVGRLRRLRATALRVRALAHACAEVDTACTAVFSRTALSCWRLARTITGHLRAHPNSSCQRDASPLAVLWYDTAARNFTYGAREPGVIPSEMTSKLRLLSRELADARSLTWSPELNDAFGRSQLEIKRLIAALEDAMCGEASELWRTRRLAVACDAERYPAGRPAHWPYLAG